MVFDCSVVGVVVVAAAVVVVTLWFFDGWFGFGWTKSRTC